MQFRNAGVMLIVIIGLLGMVGLSTGCGGLPENAAASVNGDIITIEDVDKRLSDLRKSYGPLVPVEDNDGDGELDVEYTNYRRDVTDQLVREQLELQEADARGLTASQEEIDNAMQYTADDGYLGDIERMQQSYFDRGLTLEDLEADMLRAILHEKVVADVSGEINLSDEEIQAYYDENIDQYQQPERRNVRQLVADDEATANEAVSRAAAGEFFPDLVNELSVHPDAQTTSGYLSLVKSGSGALPPELDEVAFSIKLHEVSSPVKLGEQWYVLTVEAILPPFNKSMESVSEEIRVYAAGQIISERMRKFVADVYDNADIEYRDEYDPGKKVETETVS